MSASARPSLASARPSVASAPPPSPGRLPTPGRRRRLVLVIATGAALAGAALGTPAAGAAEDDLVINVFRATYEVRTDYVHDSAHPGVTDHDALSFVVRGQLPNVRFIDRYLAEAVSSRVSTSVAGSVTANSDAPQGTSVACSGDRVQLEGLVGLGRAKVGTTERGVWFAPWLVGRGTGTCTDSNGRTGPLSLTLNLPGRVTPDARATPPGAVRFDPTFAQLDTGRWSQEFRTTYTGKECPGHDPASTTTCTATVSGRLTLDRISREVSDAANDDLLAPVKTPRPPKLDPKRRKATTTVRCPKACTVEPGIGIFRMRKDGTPWVDERPQRRRRLKARRATTITVPLTSADRTAVEQGMAVMTLEVRMAGKRYSATYPLR